MRKKIFLSIIALISFSIGNIAFAKWYIDTLLDINSGIESYDIKLEKLDSYNFKNTSTQETYNRFVSINRILRSELLRKYQSGNFEYYQMQGIIKNYKWFIYNTNKFFQYLSIKDSGITWKSIDTAILRSYQNVRIYYTRMKNIIKRKY